MTANTANDGDGCRHTISLDIFLHFSLIPAVLITGVLSFLQTRSRKLFIDNRVPFLGGRFAVVVPLDTLSSFSNRWSYGFAFGAMANSAILFFRQEFRPFILPAWAIAIEFLIGALELGLVYFPFFACLSTPFRLAGSVMGILYSVFWITITVWDVVTCPDILVKDSETLVVTHQVQHVKRLLSRRGEQSKPLGWFQRWVYEWDPFFKFPTRIIGTVISIIGLYRLTFEDFFWSRPFFTLLSSLYDGPTYVEFIEVAKISWFTATILTCFTSCGYILHILACYRKHLRRFRTGLKSFLPLKLQQPEAAVCVASIARYSGCQIAFTLWGYVIVHVVLYVFAVFVAYALVIPIKNGEGLPLLQQWGAAILSVGLVMALKTAQTVFVQTFFLQDKISPTDKQKPLALDNRKGFSCFSYFFFIYNVAVGLTTCILRLVMSMVIGTVLVSRIDRSIMQKGYERLDAGYVTWVGMIFADHYHNNPVMLSFCQLLCSNTVEDQSKPSYSLLHNATSGSFASVRARKRWMLSYTLLRNPHLILFRKHHLSSSSTAQSETAVQAWVLASQIEGRETQASQ
ncbi:stimulated by retinoic acid gene 6 protein-like isoform X2 [Oryzias melastigma]|uniref:stimulated by retinoic acid gene 6 protein-like isoform X2 n=1 Tax=Oryzias melastigma TaxID=30732 RepID=UPI000CF81CF0|nr:stimulated by retinoic acid gene 6 protein-like isoform X2 [Oryzias melastigma]